MLQINWNYNEYKQITKGFKNMHRVETELDLTKPGNLT